MTATVAALTAPDGPLLVPVVPVVPGSPPLASVSRAVRLRAVAANVLLAVAYAALAAAFFVNWQATGQVQSLLLAGQEALLIGLALARRPAFTESRTARDWLVAAVGTCGPLLLRPGLALPALVPAGLAVQLAGIVLSTGAVASLGRSFGIVAANRGVRTSGLYRVVRHPIYGTYLLSHIGFLLGNLSVQNALLVAITTASQVARVVAEERVLRDDAAYRAYARRVRARFIPFVI